MLVSFFEVREPTLLKLRHYSLDLKRANDPLTIAEDPLEHNWNLFFRREQLKLFLHDITSDFIFLHVSADRVPELSRCRYLILSFAPINLSFAFGDRVERDGRGA